MHFTNWNKKWDRWFDSDGLKALDDAEVEGAGASNAPRRHSKGIAADVDPEAAADAQSIKDEELSKKRRRKTLAAQELVSNAGRNASSCFMHAFDVFACC